MIRFALMTFVLFLIAPEASAQITYYVRVDGGSASECNGLVDAAYPGTGIEQPCAWNHPFWALPPGGVQPPRLSPGDTLLISAGSYMVGFGAPNAVDCFSDFPWDCKMSPVPAGLSAELPTRILGAGWNQGCTNPPELWGTERVSTIVDLTGSNHVEVACLEITDHSSCVEFHSGDIPCERDNYPYGSWASIGLMAADAADVHLNDLDIHGLAFNGVSAARLTDWSIENVRIAANGWAGWDGNIVGDDSNSGTMTFRRWVVEWNGCGETYPGLEPTDCWAQSAGGFGDGINTGLTGGAWIIEDSKIMFNTSDGLDLLYLDVSDPSTRVELRRVEARGNAGNQVKTRGETIIENSVIVSNCGFFEGKPYTYQVDHCSALGYALSLNLWAGTESSIINSTLYSEGDCILVVDGESCDGTESIVSRNNIFVGDVDFLQPVENSCFFFHSGCLSDPLDHDWGIIYEVKSNPCPVGTNDLCSDPLIADSHGDTFDAHLAANSPAIDSGLAAGELVPHDDFDGYPRPMGSGTDRGAYEFRVDQIFIDGFELSETLY